MFEKKHDLKNLYICQLGVCTGYEKAKKVEKLYICHKKIDGCYPIYKEIFSGLKLFNFEHYRLNKGESCIITDYPIIEVIKSEILLKGKITKKELLEIYKELNNMEETNNYIYDEKIKKLMKKYDNLK